MTVDACAVPWPVTSGPELAALDRFGIRVAGTGAVTLTGTGPGAGGSADLIRSGRWLVGSYRREQYLLEGTYLITWQLHLQLGWDPCRREYRARVADNHGQARVMRGRIAGDRLILETTGDPEVRQRMTWEATGPTGVVWTNQVCLDAGRWSTVERYHLTRGPGPASPAGRLTATGPRQAT